MPDNIECNTHISDFDNDDLVDHSINKIISIHHSSSRNADDYSKFMVPIKLGSKTKFFEIDSGSSVSIMSNKEFRDMQLNLELESTDVQFRTYTGEGFTPLASALGFKPGQSPMPCVNK